MAATIHQLPRFQGEARRTLPDGEIQFHEALSLLADRAHEWRDRLDEILQTGDYLTHADGRDHVITDAAALQACGEDLQSMVKHLRAMAAMLKDEARDNGE